MKLLQLPRDFIYKDRSSLDDFLTGDELNKKLYGVYLTVKDRPYNFKFEPEQAFNEAYYIATVAANDKHPELCVRNMWQTAKHDMGWAYAADLVMSMVYAILSLQENKSEMVKFALQVMERENYGQFHFPFFRDIVIHTSKRYNSDLSIKPCSMADIPFGFEYLRVTDNFQQESIRELVSMLGSNADKLEMINDIEAEQKYREELDANLPF